MRRILSPDEADELIRSMPGQQLIWIEDEHERKEKYGEILSRGDHAELVQVIRTLYLHREKQIQRGKKLHQSDEHFLKDAERVLNEEFALALNIKQEQVSPFIAEQLRAAADEK